MTSPELGPFRNILDEAFDSVGQLSGHGGPVRTLPEGAPITWTVDGWTPPPPEDSAFYTPLCAHRREIEYENDMALVADLRQVADEIAMMRRVAYPHLVTPLKKRRTPKKAAKP